MKLFDTSEELPIPSEEARTIKEFYEIIVRDKSKNKQHCLKELAFIHYWCAFDSRFDIYESERDRCEAIKEVVGLDVDWMPDDVVDKAADRYAEMIKTESSDLLDTAKTSIKHLREFLKDVDLNATTNGGALKLKPTEFQNSIKDLPNVIKALQEATALVRQELNEKKAKSKELSKFEGRRVNTDTPKHFI